MRKSLFNILRGSEGLTLFMVIFVMAFFLIFVTGGLFFAQLNLKIASNFKLATQAVEVADVGLQHGLAVIPWVWDFNAQLCSTPPCPVKNPDNSPMTNIPFASGFTYTVTAQNDSDGGGATNDTNKTIVLTSQASGPSNTSKSITAYIRRSLAPFTPPAALYVNAASSYPTFDSSNPGMGAYYFDNNEMLYVRGSDTNYNGSAGPNPTLYAIATTNDAVTTALKNEDRTNSAYHVISGIGSAPSISTVGDILDVDTIAQKFYDQPGAVKFLSGLKTATTASSGVVACPDTLPTPRPNPDPCVLGTSSSPQVTYIRQDTSTNTIALRGFVKGYGVLVLEGEATLGDSFKFYGLIAHKRSAATHYISVEDDARVYGAVLLGSFDEGDGRGKKARFGLKDSIRIYYSSQALTMVDSNWGALLPKPPRVLAWLDK